jgi:predicted phosphodiesterase
MALIDIINVSDIHDNSGYILEGLTEYTQARKKEGKGINSVIINGDFIEAKHYNLMEKCFQVPEFQQFVQSQNIQDQQQLQQQVPMIMNAALQNYTLKSNNPEVFEQQLEQYKDNPQALDEINRLAAVGEKLQPIREWGEQKFASEYTQMNEKLSSLRSQTSSGRIIGTLGNHDLGEMCKEYLSEVEFINGKVTDLEGLKLFGHANLQGTEAMHGYDMQEVQHLYDVQNDYSQLTDAGIDIAVLHNGIKTDNPETSMSGYENVKSIESLVNGSDSIKYVFGGHTHQDKVVQTDSYTGYASSHVIGYKHTIDTNTKKIVGTKALLLLPESKIKKYSSILAQSSSGNYYSG